MISLTKQIWSCLSNRRGNIAVIAALAMPVLIGALGLGIEAGYWYYLQRDMQNAADTAAIAAATNNSSSYAAEATATTAQYGYVNGSNNVTVASSNAAACPSGGNTCYSVTITSLVPLYLTQVIGYQGTTTLGGTKYTSVTATAIATVSQARNYCLLALANSGVQGITANGVPFADMAGCSVMSNTSANCNGHTLGALYGDAHTTSSGCGQTQENNMPTYPDKWSAISQYIPADPCGGSYPQLSLNDDRGTRFAALWRLIFRNTVGIGPAFAGSSGGSSPTYTQLSGSLSWPDSTTNKYSGANPDNVQAFCGDVQLTGNTTISTPGGSAVLVIYNGQLDTHGYTLSTANGAALSIVFAGTNGTYTHAPTDTSHGNQAGTLNFAAPTSGDFAGMAIYQAPNLTSGVNISAAGNSPTWDISGMLYLPHSSVTLDGAVNKSSNGQSCFSMVVDNVLINGTGAIYTQGACTSTYPQFPQYLRGQLVY